MKLRFALLTLALAASAFAADVSGKWTAEVKGRNGQSREITMNFKADGATLTARELNARAELWRPFRGYAVMLLWEASAQSAAAG